MAARPSSVDLGPCSGALHERDPDRCAILLPGAWYPTSAPLLWFAREAALAEGWSALEVQDLLPADEEPFAWAVDRAERALAATRAASVAVVGKSLASAAAGIAAERGLPAVWLTPVLTWGEVVNALSRTGRPTLLVGSPADEMWRGDAVPKSSALEVLELEGLDHSLQRDGDPPTSLEALRTVTEAVRAFLSRLGRS